ncbi:hypothetical protein [Eikenella halliae]|uniref:hypothetical protein n=1 Tax=Eikenella halliae TaxID=1795832 RepID=UPI0028D53BCC|nr:hypothetical protein [Eikenella halliae]
MRFILFAVCKAGRLPEKYFLVSGSLSMQCGGRLDTGIRQSLQRIRRWNPLL